MKNKITAILLITVLALALCVPAAAASQFVYDEYGLLTADQQSELNSMAETVSGQYECDVAVITVASTEGGDPYEYAKSLYKSHDIGYGSDKSGVMLMVSMEDRDFQVIAYGYGNTAFTDYGKTQLRDYYLPDLSDGDYYDSFYGFISGCEEYLRQSRDGTPIDVNSGGEGSSFPLFSILIALVIALVVCLIFKAQMKTAKPQREATEYIPQGGFVITGQSDHFTHRTESRVRIERDNDSGGGTTVDSSGFSGDGGKF